jgi:peroxiredoxin
MLLAAPASSSALENIAVGMAPPPFRLSTPAGAPVSLDYFQGGAGVIVFWATWSPRSAEILADFEGLHARWAAAGLKIVAVNADKESFSAAECAAVAHAAGHMALSFPVVLDEGLRTYAAYGVMALPSTVVIGADGRIAYTLAGYPLSYREELEQQLLVASGNAQPAPAAVAAADVDAAAAADEGPRTECVVPRAAMCQFREEGDGPGGDQSLAAMRRAICRGDAAEAERLLPAGGLDRFERPEARFALAELLLLKGGTAEARMAFAALQQRYPAEPWGAWGLGLIALAEGKDREALGHMQAAAARGGACAEAQTAVLQRLQGYWIDRRPAPVEAGFLTIFSGLASVRACFVQPRLLAGG